MRHARGVVALITSALLGYVLVTGAVPAPGANGDAGQGLAAAALSRPARPGAPGRQALALTVRRAALAASRRSSAMPRRVRRRAPIATRQPSRLVAGAAATGAAAARLPVVPSVSRADRRHRRRRGRFERNPTSGGVLPDDLRDRRAVRRRDGPGVRVRLSRRLHPLRARARTAPCTSIRTSASTAAPASPSARSTRSSRRSRCRPSWAGYTAINALWFTDKAAARRHARRRSSPPDAPAPGGPVPFRTHPQAASVSTRGNPGDRPRSGRPVVPSPEHDAHRLAPPAATEIVCALGLADDLVGITDACEVAGRSRPAHRRAGRGPRPRSGIRAPGRATTRW